VLFLNKHYAETISAQYAASPRAFLLSLTSTAPQHALLVAHWGKDGAAVLSMPTREYFQSSGWVEEKPSPSTNTAQGKNRDSGHELRSVRSGSDFWADGRSLTPASSAYFSITPDNERRPEAPYSSTPKRRAGNSSAGKHRAADDDGYDSQGTEMAENEKDGIVDEVGAHDAFVAGMMYALSRRLLPGSPYTPSWTGRESDIPSGPESEHGRWRLDECLR
jgi:hypothetical protein